MSKMWFKKFLKKKITRNGYRKELKRVRGGLLYVVRKNNGKRGLKARGMWKILFAGVR